jgi:predicted lipoprotein with Yx(FWY)xxD motif
MKNLLLVTLSFLLLLSCSDDDYGNSDDTIIQPPAENSAVQLRNDANFGNVMTNSEGFTLYFFALDSKGASNCNGGCADAWPAFFAENLTLDTGLNASEFGTITRADGEQQNTFRGWPLYLFSNDNEGDINGDGAQETWYVAKPDYTVMIAKAQLVGRDVSGTETNLTSDYTPGDEDTFYMTDTEGNTLYSFINDRADTNNFTAADFSNNGVWPLFETGLQNMPSIFNSSDFGSIDVFGRQQITYKGWPLYFFGQDIQRGDNYGVGFPAAGVWPILNQDTQAAAPVEITTFDVVNQGAAAYVFNGDDLDDAVNPSITLERGKTYVFEVNAPGHPFLIKSVQGTGTGDLFNDGVSNNGVAQGTVTFTVPQDAPDTLFYNCEFHGVMTGVFDIVD